MIGIVLNGDDLESSFPRPLQTTSASPQSTKTWMLKQLEEVETNHSLQATSSTHFLRNCKSQVNSKLKMYSQVASPKL